MILTGKRGTWVSTENGADIDALNAAASGLIICVLTY